MNHIPAKYKKGIVKNLTFIQNDLLNEIHREETADNASIINGRKLSLKFDVIDNDSSPFAKS